MTNLINHKSNWETTGSLHDNSVNNTIDMEKELGRGAMLEARWVQRVPEYGIVYVSSHTGCSLSCRFCHLTATRQNTMIPCSLNDYLKQLDKALESYKQRIDEGMQKASKLHVNFMARGEALENDVVILQSEELFERMQEKGEALDLDTHFLISSILPKDFRGDLNTILNHPKSYLYYSLYSLNPTFRKKWLPKAMDGYRGLDLCREYQEKSKQRVTLHWALIEGENDKDEDIQEIISAVKSRELRAKFNLVRYNPHDDRHGSETSEKRLNLIFKELYEAFGDQESRIVPRVGVDVKASCGMFVNNKDI